MSENVINEMGSQFAFGRRAAKTNSKTKEEALWHIDISLKELGTDYGVRVAERVARAQELFAC